MMGETTNGNATSFNYHEKLAIFRKSDAERDALIQV